MSAESTTSAGKSMTASSITLKAFTDAASDAVAREIASLRREAQREKDIRDAEHRARVAEWDLKIASVVDLQRQLTERLSTLKDGEPGRDGTNGADGKDGIDGKDGTSISVSDVEPILRKVVDEVLDTWQRPKDGQDGKSVTVEDLKPVVMETVERAVAGLPAAKDGKDGVDGTDGKDGERGPEGAPGKLPIVREWTDDVTYAGECRAFGGSTWQALRDTAKQPPHVDWQCIAKGGEDGKPARQIVVRGTYVPEGEYGALDVVALNGGTFIAKKDEPGPCPGEGWQLMSSQGKRGNPGERGPQGKTGDQGQPGDPVVSMSFDENGLLTLVNGEGSTVTCDLYPILAKLK